MNIKTFISKFQGDWVILIVTILLSVFSIFAVLSSTPDKVISHCAFIALSYGVMFFMYKFATYKTVAKLNKLFLLFAGVLLLLTILFSSNGRYVVVFGVKMQTFYLIGFLIIFYIAKYMTNVLNTENEYTSGQEWWLCGVVCIFCAGMAVTNMSTAIILFVTSIMLMFLGNIKLWRLALLICAGALVVLVYMTSDFGRGSTFKNRFEYWLTQENVNDYGTQMILAKAAIAKSGSDPTGPGHGVIKKVLPERETDYVYATVCEEFGMITGLLIIVAYLVLFTRAWFIAKECEGILGKLLAIGIGFWFTCQAFVHIGVNCELLPATGQTLPFISRGGASILLSGGAIGMLMNICKFNNIKSK